MKGIKNSFRLLFVLVLVVTTLLSLLTLNSSAVAPKEHFYYSITSVWNNGFVPWSLNNDLCLESYSNVFTTDRITLKLKFKKENKVIKVTCDYFDGVLISKELKPINGIYELSINSDSTITVHVYTATKVHHITPYDTKLDVVIKRTPKTTILRYKAADFQELCTLKYGQNQFITKVPAAYKEVNGKKYVNITSLTPGKYELYKKESVDPKNPNVSVSYYGLFDFVR